MTVGRKICLQGFEIKEFAGLLSRVLNYRGWSYTEFSKRCKPVAQGLGYKDVYEGSEDKIRNRLANIMMCCLNPKHSDTSEINWERAAKQVYQDEVDVYARTLGVHAPWLSCAGSNKSAIEWNGVNADSDLPIENLIVMTAIYEEMTAEITVVSRIVPGELMPEELMHTYLQAIYDTTELFDSKTALHRFAAFANDRRNRLRNPSKTASSNFILPFEQIDAALNGQGVFSKIDSDLRDTLATYLAELISNPLPNTNIAFPKEEQFDKIIETSRLITLSCGDMFTVQFGADGEIRYWTGRSDKTIQNSRLLTEVIVAAAA